MKSLPSIYLSTAQKRGPLLGIGTPLTEHKKLGLSSHKHAVRAHGRKLWRSRQRICQGGHLHRIVSETIRAEYRHRQFFLPA